MRLTDHRLLAPVVWMACANVVLAISAVVHAGQTPDLLKQAVERELGEDRALRTLDVTVAGGEVTLSGRLSTFWEKSEALRRAFDVNGVERVVSEIEVPVEEDQEQLAQDVARTIQRYPHYEIWDHIEGRINNGVVSLRGRVTPLRDKTGELFERIAKIRGVQDVQMDIKVLSPSREDQRLRALIARGVFRSDHFERFASMNNPPFRIIVDNSIVTLVGYVQSNIERIELQRIVAQTQGVLRVENELETIQ